MTDLGANRLTAAHGARRRRSKGRANAAADARLYWILLCVATVGGAMLFGGLHTITAVGMAALCFVAFGLCVYERSWRSIPVPAWLFFGLSAFSLLQALPLPARLVTLLSPAAADIWSRAWEVSRANGQGFMSLSLDRGATVLEALKWSMYGAAFTAAARYGAARSMGRALLLPFGAALTIGLITLAHGLAHATTVYGLYQPTFGTSIWHIGPLLNPNHLASYLNLGLFCGLGLLSARRPFLPRWLLGLGVAFMIPNAIVAGSRGGVVGLLVGALAFLLFLPRRDRADPDFGQLPKSALLATLGTVVMLSAGLTALLASENTGRELIETNVDKLRLLTWAERLVHDYPWFGVGRGAFEGVFASYRTGVNNEVYTHPENLVAQWLGEWGIVIGALALLACLWTFRPRQLGARWSAVACGALGGVSAVVVQNFADFGLEVPAIALAVVVALGGCWGHAEIRRDGGRRRSESRGRRSTVLIPIAAAGLLICALPLLMDVSPLPIERLSLATRYRELEGDQQGALASLQRENLAAVEAHPAEAYFYRLGALLAWRLGNDPMPWLERAIERAPSMGRTHLLVARVLADRKAAGQALMELKLATTFDPALAPITARAATTWTHDFSQLLKGAPEGANGVTILVAMAKELGKLPEVRERLLKEASERGPSRREPALLLAQDSLGRLESTKPDGPCRDDARGECIALTDERLKTLEKISGPTDLDAVLLRARFFKASGRVDDAITLLSERCPPLSGHARTQCRKAQLDMAASAKGGAAFDVASHDYLADNCADADTCAVALEKVGDLTASRGDSQAAFSFYDRASRERFDDRLLMKVARAGLRIGAYDRALSVLERVHNKKQYEPEYSKLIEQARFGGLGIKR